MAVGGPIHGTPVEVGTDPHQVLTVRVQSESTGPGTPHEYTLDAITLLGNRFAVYLWNDLDPKDLDDRICRAFLRAEVFG